MQDTFLYVYTDPLPAVRRVSVVHHILKVVYSCTKKTPKNDYTI